MAHVYVSPDGTENTARWRVVRILVPVMDSAGCRMTRNGSVSATTAGTAKIAAYC